MDVVEPAELQQRRAQIQAQVVRVLAAPEVRNSRDEVVGRLSVAASS